MKWKVYSASGLCSEYRARNASWAGDLQWSFWGGSSRWSQTSCLRLDERITLKLCLILRVFDSPTRRKPGNWQRDNSLRSMQAIKLICTITSLHCIRFLEFIQPVFESFSAPNCVSVANNAEYTCIETKCRAPVSPKSLACEGLEVPGLRGLSLAQVKTRSSSRDAHPE